ncbi:fatty acid desaturase [Aestuariivirga sp.]|uniref:fatty acid desaturase n=1 Tax=Aestuariivirga sp. TaxID=2650926 RepID=UPI00391C8E34
MDQMASTVRQEAEIGRRHTPDFGGRTLLLEIELFALFLAATALTVMGIIPMWAGFIANTVFIYALYTVVHEAVHANISSRRKELRWLDTAAGIVACVPLWLNYHQHKRQHMAHHAHTNEETDPDIYARGSFPGWVFLRLPVALINYFNPVQQYRDCRRFNCTNREIAYTALSFSAYWAALLGLLAAGYWKEVLFLWFVPWWIGQTVMLTFFTWTPHHDHHETGRYRNTRVSLFPFANFLLQGQNYHLIHHMLPAIPYYRYEAAFNELRPILEAKGARIEGLIPDPRNERHETANA